LRDLNIRQAQVRQEQERQALQVRQDFLALLAHPAAIAVQELERQVLLESQEEAFRKLLVQKYS
jgi:adenylate cyclase